MTSSDPISASRKAAQNARRITLTLIALGRYLREYRELVRRHNQQSAADEMGISRGTLSTMERGSPGPSIGAWVAAWAYMGQLDHLEALTHDDHVIAEATARLIMERSQKKREKQKASS